MKIKQIIVAGLLLSGLTGLIAGVLSLKLNRTFNTKETVVLGDSFELKKICYIETHDAFTDGAARNFKDLVLKEFLPGGTFDYLCEQELNLTNLIQGLFSLKEDQSQAPLLYLWFIRKNLDDRWDFSHSSRTQNDMIYFHKSHETIFKTLGEANKWLKKQGDVGFGCDCTNCGCWPTAFSCVDDQDCLDYPTCFANLIAEENQ